VIERTWTPVLPASGDVTALRIVPQIQGAKLAECANKCQVVLWQNLNGSRGLGKLEGLDESLVGQIPDEYLLSIWSCDPKLA
jgi:hypothetical protein